MMRGHAEPFGIAAVTWVQRAIPADEAFLVSFQRLVGRVVPLTAVIQASQVEFGVFCGVGVAGGGFNAPEVVRVRPRAIEVVY
ncbi:hypothetical protein [Acetobacter cerevisiae]|uniref:hypothetical protein n=1 Tax=Acetobacter cerevisiae TaxID=178900 RepID=UPI0012E7ED60